MKGLGDLGATGLGSRVYGLGFRGLAVRVHGLGSHKSSQWKGPKPSTPSPKP